MTTRRGLAGCGIAAAALLLFGCAAGPGADDWRLSPVTVNDGSAGPSDVTYVIWNISDDTAGGVWTESAGSWLGIAADGAITRFNAGPEYGRTAFDITALNATMLYVLRPLGSGQLNTTVELFDTATRASEPVLTGQRVPTSPDPVLPFTADGLVTVDSPFGPITSIDVDPSGRLVFVERVDLPRHSSEQYVVRRMSRDGALETLAGMAPPAEGVGTEVPVTQPRDGEQLRGHALTAASVDVSAGDPAGIVIGTEHGVFQIREDGTARVIDGALPADSPRRAALGYGPGYRARLVDATESGAVVLPVATAPEPAPMWVAGGSTRFRELLEGGINGWGTEPPAGLAVQDGTMRSSEALARTRNAVWVAPGVLVGILPGGGDESALARIELPPPTARPIE